MKAVLQHILCIACIIVLFYACTKTEGTINNNPNGNGIVVVPGAIVSSGDTFWVSSANVTFRIVRTSQCAPSNEVFFDSITKTTFNNNVEYSWVFGNSQPPTGSGISVSHYYNYGGVYPITLNVKSNGVIVQSITTSVKAYGRFVTPTASFGSTLNNYRDPNWVAFNAQSSVTEGSIINYAWDWKDGTTSSVATPYTEHRFPEIDKDSIYPVTLTVTSHAGCKATVTNKIFVPSMYNNVGEITYTKTPACLPDSQVFTFTMDTTGLPAHAKFYWDFGDGTKPTTNYWEGNPIKHSFTYSKAYPIVCRIEVSGVTKREFSRNISIYALGRDINPIPYLSKVTYLNPPARDYVQLDGWGKVGDGHIITKLVWDFADGTKDSLNTPYVFHQFIPPYPVNRTYPVRLTVTASSGCVGTDTFHIKIP